MFEKFSRKIKFALKEFTSEISSGCLRRVKHETLLNSAIDAIKIQLST